MLGQRFDAYTLKARVYPSLLTLLPAFLAVIAWVPEARTVIGSLVSLAVGSGGAYLLSEFGRDRGRKLQPKLFGLWGGKPTTVELRHVGNLNPLLLARRHAQVGRVTGVDLPSAEDERKNRHKADQAYDTAVSALIEKARDRQRFPLVFAENLSYGFRRNLWGLKVAAVPIALVSLAAASARAYLAPSALPVTCAVLCGIAVVMWLFLVTPSWVRIPADAYSRALLASLEVLDQDAGAATP
jgi:hypothetical protein